MGQRLQTHVIIFGLAFAPVSWLKLGAGFTFSMVSSTYNDILVNNPLNPSQADINVKVSMDFILAPVGGITFAYKGFALAFSMRDSQSFQLLGSNKSMIHGMEGTDDYIQEIPLNHHMHFSPLTISAGLSYSMNGFTITSDASYLMWSAYVDNHGKDAGFDDSFELGIGTEVTLFKVIRARTGFKYAASPVPDQIGRTNFADNDKYFITVGAGYTVTLLGLSFIADAHLQFVMLPERVTFKKLPDTVESCTTGTSSICDEDDSMTGLQTGNTGFPGFSSAGYIIAGGVTITWVF
jgi:long-chain fatty acid transport protein